MDRLKEMMKDLEKLQVKEGQLQWTQFTVGYDFGIKEANDAIMDFYKDKENYQVVLDAEIKAESEEDKRIAQIAKRAFESFHMSDEINELNRKIEEKTNELSKVLNTFRFKLDGKEVTSVEIMQILMGSEDRELRKKAYLCRNQINQPLYDAGFLELVDMRKQLAKLNGYDSFVDYMLYKNDLHADIFSDWKNQIKEVLPEIKRSRKEYANKYLKDDVIYPWDEAFVSASIAPSLNSKVDLMNYYEVVKSYFAKFGFNLDEYGIVFDVYSRKNKSEWGYFFPIEEGVDARILANVKDRYYEYNVLMHETGHGVHHSLNDKEKFILNSGISGIVTEGIANLFGSQIYTEPFFAQFFEGDLEKVKEEFDALVKWDKINAFRQVGLIMFDQNFYRTELSSLDDIHQMYWDTFNDYFEDEAGDYQPPWAYKIHHTTHPIYLHNYFMGDVTCEMLKSVFNKRENVDAITDQAESFGEFLFEEVIEPSGRYTYSELFERISGEKFSLKYMLD